MIGLDVVMSHFSYGYVVVTCCVAVPDKRMLHYASQAKTLAVSLAAMKSAAATADDDDVTATQPQPGTSRQSDAAE